MIIWLVLFALLSLVFFMTTLVFYQQKKAQTKILKTISQQLTVNSDKLLFQTSSQEVQQLLNALNRLLDDVAELKKETLQSRESVRKMLANISHDLKTPLTVIVGYSEILQNAHKNDFSVEDQHKIDKIQEKSREVLEMLQEFFDLMKLEAGDHMVMLERLDLVEIVRAVVLEYYEQIEEEQIRVELLLPNQGVWIKGDVLMLQRIFRNLVQNALQYGQAGKYLGIKMLDEENEITVQIIDHGKGITENHQDKVFERLYTLEDSRNKKYQGSGLGLTITKRLVENLQGNIYLYSKPFEETVFSVKLLKDERS